MARSVLQGMPAIGAKPLAHPAHNTPQGVKLIRRSIGLGFPAHRIAALFDINQGGINEVKKGKRDADVTRLVHPGGAECTISLRL
jgi:hypothetical protein